MKKVINFLIFAFARVQHIFYLFIARLLNKEYQMVTPGASYAPWVLDKEFLKELRSDPSINFISVFVLTTSNDDYDRKEAYQHNVAGYFVKPVDISQFETTFQTLSNFWKICVWP